MDAYVYNAALWCDDCIAKLKSERVKPEHVDEENEASYDSDEWPKGPFADGGGEASCPQHCDGCGAFLENPLTSYGYNYTAEHVADAITVMLNTARVAWSETPTVPYRSVALDTWAPFYGFKLRLVTSEDDSIEESIRLTEE